MNIQNLPSEILEKILVEGNFLSVSRVCQIWRYHAQRNKSQFDEVFFDLTKDDPEKIEKENPNQLFIFNSRTIDKNGFWVGPEIVTSDRIKFSLKLCNYLNEEFPKIFNKITFVNTLNIIYDPLLYIKLDESPYLSKIYILSDNIFTDNEDQKITGLINRDYLSFQSYLHYCLNKTKNINIKIKDVCNRIENIDPEIFFKLEIGIMDELIYYQAFEDFEKFTFNAPNNAYIIYNENKKILIIRFGNYEKYNFPMKKKLIGQISNNTLINKHYLVNCFMRNNSNFIVNFYPARLIRYDYEKATEKVETLIIISSELYVFMFDQLLEFSKKETQKKIKYHCFNSSEMKSEQENFEFVSVEKEKEQEYTFEQMHFKHFGENAF